MERLDRLAHHLGGAAPAPALASGVIPHWKVSGAADPPPFSAGDPGIPSAQDPSAPLSVFLLLGQSSMAGRGMLPAFSEPIPDIQGFHYLFDSWDVAREPLHF
eukprot:SAG22_NODE_11074_length_502_cov_0.990074_1_plen_102_part_10